MNHPSSAAPADAFATADGASPGAPASARSAGSAVSAGSGPWWRHGHVWMIVAGPVLVVLASIVTVLIAVRQPDPVVAVDYYRRGIEINKSLAAGEPISKSVLPAMQGRNHAASPAPGAAPEALQPADR